METLGERMAAFVVSLNLKRRHLNESQRAVVAAKLATLGHGGDRSKSPIGDLKQSEAAQLLNVGKRSVERAREVLDEGAPELVQAVEQGRVSVSATRCLSSPRPSTVSRMNTTLRKRGVRWLRDRTILDRWGMF